MIGYSESAMWAATSSCFELTDLNRWWMEWLLSIEWRNLPLYLDEVVWMVVER